jgi:hypothetical protein
MPAASEISLSEVRSPDVPKSVAAVRRISSLRAPSDGIRGLS